LSFFLFVTDKAFCRMRWREILKACKYCGGIHKADFICPRKPKSQYVRDEKIVSFRNSKEWKEKREKIKQRDCGCCVACWHNMAGTLKRINTRSLSVHHIVPLVIAWALRLCDNNLITLCEHHHEAAEKGEIPQQLLFDLVKKGVKISPPEMPFREL